MSAVATAPLLSLRGVGKKYGDRWALHPLDLDIRGGHIHGLVGQNGSGKSTLIKILSGYHAAESGAEIRHRGEEISLPASGQLEVSVVHQDLAVIDTMSIADNFSGPAWDGTSAVGPIRWGAARKQTVEECARLGMEVAPNENVSTLAPLEKAMLACARALRSATRATGDCVLLLDEPTAYMSHNDAAVFNSFVRRVASSDHIAVVYVSHRLEELKTIADTITVLRDGQRRVTLPAAEANVRQLVEEMLGKAIVTFERHQRTFEPGGERLTVTGLSGEGCHDLSFDVAPGEILGVTGLVGMGQDDLPYLMIDPRRRDSGEVTMSGTGSSGRDIRPRLGLAPGNRQRLAAWTTATCWENISLPVINSYWQRGFLRRSNEIKTARKLMEQMNVIPPDPLRTVRTFSGGNQQKILLCKVLQNLPRFVVLHEPLQGIDIGGKAEIAHQLLELAEREGLGIVFCSSDAGDLALVCDRVLVLRHGEIVQELPAGSWTEEDVVSACQTTQSETQPTEKIS